jgi:hypothetical protein
MMLKVLMAIHCLFTVLYSASISHTTVLPPLHTAPNYNSFVYSTSVINKCVQKADSLMFVETEPQGDYCAIVWGTCSGVACFG